MDYLRRYILLQAYKSMTDEERRFLSSEEDRRRHSEVMSELSTIKKQGSFARDFAANVTGSAAYDAGLYLLKFLFKRLQ